MYFSVMAYSMTYCILLGLRANVLVERKRKHSLLVKISFLCVRWADEYGKRDLFAIGRNSL